MRKALTLWKMAKIAPNLMISIPKRERLTRAKREGQRRRAVKLTWRREELVNLVRESPLRENMRMRIKLELINTWKKEESKMWKRVHDFNITI